MEEQGTTQDTLISEGTEEDNITAIDEEMVNHDSIAETNGEIDHLPDISHTDCLDGVEIETVMPEHVQLQRENMELDRQPTPTSIPPQQECFEHNLQELSLTNDHPEIEEIQCFPIPTDDNEEAIDRSERTEKDEVEVVTDAVKLSENGPTENSIELDDPIVETVHFSAENSATGAETMLMEEEPNVDLGIEHSQEIEPAASLPVNTNANIILETENPFKEDIGECAKLGASDVFKNVKFSVCEDINDLDKVCDWNESKVLRD